MSLLTLLSTPTSGGGGGGSVLDYASLFSSLGATGWVFHGGAGGSEFFEESDGTVPAITHNVSPVGRILDISGSGNHLYQDTSVLKPLFRTDGTHKWMRFGTFSGATRSLRPLTDTFVTTQQTDIFLAVYRGVSTMNNYAVFASTYINNWSGGGYFRFGLNDPLGIPDYICDTDVGTTNTSAVPAGTPCIVVARRAGTGVNQVTLTTYDLSGAVIGTATGTDDAIPWNRIQLGYLGVDSTDSEFAFSLHCDKDLGPSGEAAVVADLVQSFSGWTP